jgi:hypothetical protein
VILKKVIKLTTNKGGNMSVLSPEMFKSIGLPPDASDEQIHNRMKALSQLQSKNQTQTSNPERPVKQGNLPNKFHPIRYNLPHFIAFIISILGSLLIATAWLKLGNYLLYSKVIGYYPEPDYVIHVSVISFFVLMMFFYSKNIGKNSEILFKGMLTSKKLLFICGLLLFVLFLTLFRYATVSNNNGLYKIDRLTGKVYRINGDYEYGIKRVDRDR